MWSVLIAALGAWALFLVVFPLLSRRPRITLEALLAVALALGARPARRPARRPATGPARTRALGLSADLRFPGVRLAMAAAAISVVNAHLDAGRWP